MGPGKKLLCLMEKVGSMAEAGRGSLHPLGLTNIYLKLLFGSNARWGSHVEGNGDSCLILPPQYMVDSNHCCAVAHMTHVGIQVTRSLSESTDCARICIS